MISQRINTLVSFSSCANIGVYDVGSDHGYLLIELRKYSQTLNLKGVENKIGPFNRLKDATSNKNIEVSLSDGIDELTSNYDTLVLAGLGYETIKTIISKHIDKLDYIENIIVDSHNYLDKIRFFFTELNYFVNNEEIIEEKGIFYEIIHFKKGNFKYSKEDFIFGPILLKNKSEVFKNKYKKLIKKNDEILKQIPSESEKYNELLVKNNLYKRVIDEN